MMHNLMPADPDVVEEHESNFQEFQEMLARIADLKYHEIKVMKPSERLLGLLAVATGAVVCRCSGTRALRSSRCASTARSGA